MILFFMFLQILPAQEFFLYETNADGKIGNLEITSRKDSLGYHILYTSDRTIEAILDSLDLRTLYVKKLVNGRQELKILNNKNFEVYFKGEKMVYQEDGPVYDRHTLDFALRGFEYNHGYKKKIRVHIPEVMIVNAELMVVGEEVIKSPLGEIPCWKIEMTPRIFFIRKKLYFWFEKDYPHRFIKLSDASEKNQMLLINSIEYTPQPVDSSK